MSSAECGGDTLKCGCVLSYRESQFADGVSLIFLTPCSEAHRRVGENVRSAGGVRTSSLVVKGVPKWLERP